MSSRSCHKMIAQLPRFKVSKLVPQSTMMRLSLQETTVLGIGHMISSRVLHPGAIIQSGACTLCSLEKRTMASHRSLLALARKETTARKVSVYANYFSRQYFPSIGTKLLRFNRRSSSEQVTGRTTIPAKMFGDEGLCGADLDMFPPSLSQC